MTQEVRIPTSVWLDDRFQTVWAGRWTSRSSTRAYGRANWNRSPMSDGERLCRKRRSEFSSRRVRIRSVVMPAFGWRCAMCGAQGHLTLDHIVPICWGGTNDLVNFQPLCEHCNSVKGHALPKPPLAFDPAGLHGEPAA